MYKISLRHESLLFASEYDHIQHFTAVLHDVEDTDTGKFAGALTLYHIHEFYDDEYQCPTLTADYEDGDLLEAVEAVWDCRKECFREQLDLQSYGTILALQKLCILPSYRGKKLGLALIKRTIELIGSGAGIVILSPGYFDIFDSRAELTRKEEAAINQALKNRPEYEIKKLERYYASLGFIKVPKKNVMYHDMACLMKKVPDPDDCEITAGGI